MARPSATLKNGVFALRPAKAEPLLLDADVNAYSTSLKPWGPPLASDAAVDGRAMATAEPTSTSTGTTRMYRLKSLTSVGPIRLPM